MKINLGDTITTKKVHPCGSNVWTIIRTGADVKMKCTKCERVIMIPLDKLDKIIKK